MKKYSYYETQTYASGEIYISSVMDSLIAQAYYNSCLINVLDKFLVGKFDETIEKLDIQHSNLFPLRVPKAFLGKKFTLLFHY